MVRISVTMIAFAALAATAQQQYASAQNFKCHGINYNIRAGPDWAPDATKCKSADVIAQELVKLKTITDTIRLYSLTDCNQGSTVVPAAVKAGLKVSLGLWVGPEAATFKAEKAKFTELLAQDGLINAKDIVGIHVGSEAVYRGDVNTTVAISNFDEIKKLCTAKNLDIPVTIADIGDIYLQYPELVDAVDVVSANAFPFWEKIDADKAASYMYSRLEPLIEMAAKQNKEVIIGETGWATDGVQAAASDATPENAATYFHDFYTLAQQHSLKYFYFAGFDEQWKIATLAANATVEAYFGLFKESGDLKDEYKALTFDASSSSSLDVDVSGSTASSSSEDESVVVPTSGTATASSSDDESAATSSQGSAADASTPGASGDVGESVSGGSTASTATTDDNTNAAVQTGDVNETDAYPSDSITDASAATPDSASTDGGDDAYPADAAITGTTDLSTDDETAETSTTTMDSENGPSADDNSVVDTSDAYSTDDNTASTATGSAPGSAAAAKSTKRKDCDV